MLSKERFWAGLVLVALGVLVTFDAWADIIRIALRDEESSHIFLVPIVAGWLVWIRRVRWRQCRLGGTVLGAHACRGRLVATLVWRFFINPVFLAWRCGSYSRGLFIVRFGQRRFV